ncbi:hypothetical protein [uncultured Anaerococcus sp.]|uniref:hypothetical protein n=1 Tax=uncultured Anaerococcus sp. TaxID=293428 RepID=UPI00262089A8|nr:hypothetical protein [uncultured Anaerococcus sp.]
MSKFSKICRYILSSTILFTILTGIISLSVWLDMRVHSRYVVYASFILMLIFILAKDFKTGKTLIIGEIIMLIIFGLGKFSRVAYELREAFRLDIKIDNFKILLIVIIILTSIITYYDYYKNNKLWNKVYR